MSATHGNTWVGLAVYAVKRVPALRSQLTLFWRQFQTQLLQELDLCPSGVLCHCHIELSISTADYSGGCGVFVGQSKLEATRRGEIADWNRHIWTTW